MYHLFHQEFGFDIMKIEDFILFYLRKTKNKRLTKEVLKDAYVDTFHIGDSFLYQSEEIWIIIGFSMNGAWIIKETDLRNKDIKEEKMNFIPYLRLLYLYCDSVYGYKKRGCEISEVGFLKYKMQYEFFRNLDFKPCLEKTDGFEPYLNKSVFQIFCKAHAKCIRLCRYRTIIYCKDNLDEFFIR